ncbi:4Fe-4S binding protein [Oceaniglobus roseus]|uniref:4Fe-4S binding protein n=1 Tax=Oceaniglobus roseus TaxID=1737570 RepID=UPI000C7EB793|nr:4Fe-4S binding protein [Kandeliimicrobium roseum]
MTKTLMICSCLGTQKVDQQALNGQAGVTCSPLYAALCTAQVGAAAKAMAEGEVMIACRQEAPRFRELAAELGVDEPALVDLRDRAGWSDEAAAAGPKQAALAAEAQLRVPLARTMDVVSEGTCLVLGAGAVAEQAARDLADHLAVTLLLSEPGDLPVSPGFDTAVGRLSRAQGALGGFEVRIDAFRPVIPGGRGAPTLEDPRDGAKSRCDIILDLSGNPPLFPAHEKREGYLRADPGSQGAVAKAVLEASHLVGTFEKPLHVRLEPSLCAHSRAGQPACSNCLDICPTGAISPAGDHVSVDPMICAGCGACSALCPSGAIALDAPPVETVFRRLSTLASTYLAAGGAAPRLLVHDAPFGAEMIGLAARHGRGLPADVIPLEVTALAGFGHAEMLAALACGFVSVDILLAPRTERDTPEREALLAGAVAGQGRVALLDLADPDALSDRLYGAEVPAPLTEPVLPMGSRRQIARLAAKAIHGEAVLPLPEHAPYGAVLVDTDACTLCLSCVSLCPSGALGDNPDLPQLRFQEDACLQCGLCANICPEDAITLKPQLNLAPDAFSQVILNEEEPFACIECGSLFGVKSTIERITEKLAGKHSMFANPNAARMIQMCDDCRVKAQYHSQDNPFAMGERPRVRTADSDGPSKRRDH